MVTTSAPPEILDAPGARLDSVLDHSPFNLFHLKAIAISGMGFFTDAYDLTVISTVLVILKPLWGLDAGQVALIGSSSLIASALGALMVGRLSDVFGRKAMYGAVAVVMVLGALATAVAPSYAWLLVLRFVLGMAIGGDYPVSSTLMTEYANIRERGRMVAMMFLSYALGSIAGPLVALILLALDVDQDLTWRLLLGLGAVPSLCVLLARRRMPESPRYVSEVRADHDRAAADLATFSNVSVTARPDAPRAASTLVAAMRRPGVWIALLGTAGAWFAFDVAYYGNTISAPLLVQQVDPDAGLMKTVAVNLVLYSVFALPAFACTIRWIDAIGHTRLQKIGLAGMTVGFGAIAVSATVSSHLPAFIAAYGVSSFFTWFGPGVTTLILAGEVFDTGVRATAHGFAAGMAKVGAFIGALTFPPLLAHAGLQGAQWVAAACCLVALACTFALREPSRRALHESAVR